MGPLPQKAAALVQIAHQNSERLARIINDILDIGKIDAGALDLRMVDVSLRDLVQQSVEANMGYAEKHEVRFLLDTTSSTSGRVTVDADRLVQVLSNLLSNAAKFSPPGADVRIRVLAAPRIMRVEVEDSGRGIPENFRSRVFEQFAQADHTASRRFEGTGLGLHIARKLLEAMNGTIGFSTVLDQGTIFYFELPRVDDELHSESLPKSSYLPLSSS
jgi:signal transduction histidine kinase